MSSPHEAAVAPAIFYIVIIALVIIQLVRRSRRTEKVVARGRRVAAWAVTMVAIMMASIAVGMVPTGLGPAFVAMLFAAGFGWLAHWLFRSTLAPAAGAPVAQPSAGVTAAPPAVIVNAVPAAASASAPSPAPTLVPLRSVAEPPSVAAGTKPKPNPKLAALGCVTMVVIASIIGGAVWALMKHPDHAAESAESSSAGAPPPSSATGTAGAGDASTTPPVGATSPLFAAIDANDTSKVADILAHGHGLANAAVGGETPLYHALNRQGNEGWLPVVRLLVESGADVNAVGCQGPFQLPLSLCGLSNGPSVALYLLDHGADPNRPASDAFKQRGMTMLILSITGGQFDTAVAIVQHGADVNALDINHMTPLANLADLKDETVSQSRGDAVALARALLEHGADVNSPDQFSCSPLFLAASLNRLALSEYLISAGADINQRGKTNAYDTEPRVTPLGIAEQKGFQEVASMLQRHGGTE